MRKLILLTTTLAVAGTAAAQDLNLFEPIEQQAEQGPVRGPEVAPTNTSGQPAFYLRGLSRFGDVYKVQLVNRSGQIAKLNWQPGQQADLEGYSGFSVVDVDAKGVTLVHPAEDSCLALESAGVTCMAANMATLQLAPAAALAVNGSAARAPVSASFSTSGNVPQPGVVVDSNGQQVFINPFSGEPEAVPQITEAERQDREARQRERAARLGAFEVQRIAPEDVRPGMRVVRTPFGDREVPIRE